MGLNSWPGSSYSVLGQNILLSQYLSPPINGYQLANLMQGVTLQWTRSKSRGSIPTCFKLQKLEIIARLMGLRIQMQTSPTWIAVPAILKLCFNEQSGVWMKKQCFTYLIDYIFFLCDIFCKLIFVGFKCSFVALNLFLSVCIGIGIFSSSLLGLR